MTEAYIEKKSRELLSQIKNARPDLNIKGTTYYISLDGNDSADGKTPDTAWKSLDKLTQAVDLLQEGDAVLFRCGDIFRGQFRMANGVTYACFGDGNKPEIWGAYENAVELDWKKEDAENVYSIQLPHKNDIGNIVFNHGEAIGIKHDDRNPGIEMDLDFEVDENTHILYLYSEYGNPSKRFDDIELCVYKTMLDGGGNNTTIDSLVFKYGAGHAVQVGSIDYTDPQHPRTRDIPIHNFTIRNCEFEWIGGGRPDGKNRGRLGNAIELWGAGDNILWENNYINQVYDAGITQQYVGRNWNTELSVNITNVIMRNNLIENCTYSYEFFLTELELDNSQTIVKKDTKAHFENILFENNICRKAGYGWGNQRLDRHTPSHIKSWDHTNYAENFVIKNNIFDRGDYRLLELQTRYLQYPFTLEGNIYSQYRGKELITENGKISYMNNATVTDGPTYAGDNATIIFAIR